MNIFKLLLAVMRLVSLWPAGGDMPFPVRFCELAHSYIPELWVIFRIYLQQ